jgi:hypothetical protein
VTQTREQRNASRQWWGNMNKRYNLKGVGIDGKIILKWILKKQDRRAWIGFIFLRIRARFRTL